MEKLSELSKPVQIFKHPAGRNFWSVSADSNAGQQDVEAFYSQEYVSALLAELEAKTLECRGIQQERELFRIERAAHQQHAQGLEKRIAELEVLLARNIKRAKKLGEQLDTPVQLQNCDFESVAIMAHWCTDEQLKAWVKGVEHAKKQIRAAGFKIEGDE